MIRTIAILVTFLWATPIQAHELRPGFLEVHQESADRYTVRFKVPARGDLRLRLRVQLPSSCINLQPPRSERAGTGILDRLVVSCPSGLDNREIVVDGLATTYTDVVARVVHLDGTVQSARLTPDQPQFRVLAAPTWRDTARTYFLLGLQHILMGVDHLMCWCCCFSFACAGSS
jgi:hypothetical protein